MNHRLQRLSTLAAAGLKVHPDYDIKAGDMAGFRLIDLDNGLQNPVSDLGNFISSH
jgi:hypothetical protein